MSGEIDSSQIDVTAEKSVIDSPEIIDSSTIRPEINKVTLPEGPSVSDIPVLPDSKLSIEGTGTPNLPETGEGISVKETEASGDFKLTLDAMSDGKGDFAASSQTQVQADVTGSDSKNLDEDVVKKPQSNVEKDPKNRDSEE
jgi:hypothetical protein